MRPEEVRLPGAHDGEPCEAFDAGVCPVLTGHALKGECGRHMECRLMGSTALVAEDDDTVLRLNTLTLEMMGLRVIPCDNGHRAYTTVLEDMAALDVAVLDIMLPGKDGFEICRAVRSRSQDLPVVFATGYNEQDIAKVMEDLKANALISKPFTLVQLRQVVGAMLCTFIGHRFYGA